MNRQYSTKGCLLLVSLSVVFGQYNNQYQQQPYQQQQQQQQYQQQPYQQQQQQRQSVSQQQPVPNYQQQNQQYAQNQYQNNNGQYQRPPGFISNQPRTATNLADLVGQNQTGAVIQVQLKSYSNPALVLPNGMTCICPSGKQCPYLRTTGSQCYFSFTTIISAPDQSVQYLATDFLPLNNDGAIDDNRTVSNWSMVQTLYLSAKPSAIDVFVHHLGVVIDQQTATLQYFNNLVHADTFVQSLSDYLPAAAGMTQSMRDVTLTGQLLSTKLVLSYAVTCSTYMGPNCDLTCVPSTSDNTVAICTDQKGVQNRCVYQSGKTQVDNCIACTYGASNDSCFASYNAPPAPTTSNAFRTWTIVLGCLLGIAIIFIVAMIIFYIIARNREEPPAYRSSTWSQQPAARPLLSNGEPKQHNFQAQDNDVWGYKPPQVAATQRSAAPMAEHETSRQSASTHDDSQSSYRPNGQPVSLARREAQV
jgi:hypothetical protein